MLSLKGQGWWSSATVKTSSMVGTNSSAGVPQPGSRTVASVTVPPRTVTCTGHEAHIPLQCP